MQFLSLKQTLARFLLSVVGSYNVLLLLNSWSYTYLCFLFSKRANIYLTLDNFCEEYQYHTWTSGHSVVRQYNQQWVLSFLQGYNWEFLVHSYSISHQLASFWKTSSFFYLQHPLDRSVCTVFQTYRLHHTAGMAQSISSKGLGFLC